MSFSAARLLLVASLCTCFVGCSGFGEKTVEVTEPTNGSPTDFIKITGTSPESSVVAAPEPRSIRVCAWNIRKLGYENRPPRPPRDYALMSRIIKQHCDIVGIVEVMALVGGIDQPGYSALAAAMGADWSNAINARALPGNNDHNDEKYAFFWKSSRIQTCAGFGVRTYPDPLDEFVREPALACFQAPSKDSGMDFLLALYHAPSPSKKPEIRIPGLPSVIEWMHQQQAGEEDLIIAGDFNLKPPELKVALDGLKQPSGPFRVSDLQSVFRESPSGTTLNRSGDITNNHYDHFVIVYPKATQELMTHTVFDDRKAVPDRVEQKNQYFHQAISDHLMVRITLNVTGPDDD